MKKIIIIYDSDHPGAFENKCFDESYAALGPGHIFTVELARQARLRGYTTVTSDVFLKTSYPTEVEALCITDMYSKRTNALLKKGVIPFLCFSTESPIIARNFYVNIKKLAGRFFHNMQFRGTAERLMKTKTQFSTMYFPIDTNIQLPRVDWRSRRLLVLINRNKRMFHRAYSNPMDIAKTLLSPIKIQFQKIIDPWIRSKEIYKDRIEAINFFSANEGFSLYGHGWENKIIGFPERYHRAAIKAFKGSLAIGDKLSVMSKHKFAICFENCVFPGYVTEKIFDCFLSGCIPVYYGAPDIEDFVPPNTYVDYRKFQCFEALEHHLVNMSETDALTMLDSAKAFIESKDFEKYYYVNVVTTILNKIDQKN